MLIISHCILMSPPQRRAPMAASQPRHSSPRLDLPRFGLPRQPKTTNQLRDFRATRPLPTLLSPPSIPSPLYCPHSAYFVCVHVYVYLSFATWQRRLTMRQASLPGCRLLPGPLLATHGSPDTARALVFILLF